MKQIVRRTILVVLCLCVAVGIVPYRVSANAIQSKVSTQMDTYEQYLADFYLRDETLEFFLECVEFPYHTYVNNTPNGFEEVLATWRLSTMDANDITGYSTKEVHFYVLLIYDVIYQEMHTNSSLKNTITQNDTLMTSAVAEVAKISSEVAVGLMPDVNIMEDNWESVLNTIVNTETFGSLMQYADTIASCIEFTGTVGELFEKLTTMKAFLYASEEIHQILTDIYNSTSDRLLKDAVNEIRMIASNKLTETEIKMFFGGDIALDAARGFALEKCWDAIAAVNPIAQAIVQGAHVGKKVGKLASNALFDTDAVSENWYSMEKVQILETNLKSLVKKYMSNFEKNPTYKNAVKLNRAVEMYMNTMSVGMEYAVHYAEAVKGGGILGWLYKNVFQKKEYETIMQRLENSKNYIDDVVEYFNNESYNRYLEGMEIAGLIEIPYEKTSGYVTEEEVSNGGQEFSFDLVALANQHSDQDAVYTKDLMTYANYYLEDGTLDLNGQTLTVYGDFYISGGKLNIHGGKLEVLGDFYQTGGTVYLNGGAISVAGNATMANKNADGNYVALGTGASLTMDNEEDTFTIGGNLITAYNSGGYVTCSAGTMKVGGNWTNYAGNLSGTNFDGSNTFTVVMTGIKNVAIDGKRTMEIPVLKIENASNRNITMQGTVYTGSLVGGNVTVTAVKTPALHFGKTDGKLTIHGDVQLGMQTQAGGNVEIHGSATLDDTILYGHEMTVDGDLTIQGNVTIGNAGTEVFGKITADGSMWQTSGNIKLNYGALTIVGNATMANKNADGNYTALGTSTYLTMDNEADAFTIGGNLITAYRGGGWVTCSAGTMKIGGNWTNYAGNLSGTNFDGSDTFTVVMTGTENVAIDGKRTIEIPVLKIENAPNRNITMRGTVYTGSLTGGNVTVTAVKTPVLHFGKIDGTLKISGDLALGLTLKNKNTASVYGNVYMTNSENITLSSGSILNIEGDLIQQGGTVQPAGGSLKIYGDYRIRSGSDSDGWSNSSGVLKMTNTQDFVLVGGDFYTQSSDSHSSYLTAGEMVIYGDFYQLAGDGNNFRASGTHKVYLCGDAQQSVKFNSANSVFNTLQLRYTKDGYIFDPDPCWNNLIEGQELPESYKLTYMITYNANGGEGQPDPQEKTQKKDLVLSDAVPTREAHKFLGWATEANAATAEYLPESTYSDDKSVVLYAVWEPIRYTVSYDANGGQGAPEAQTGAYGAEISVSSTVPTPAKKYTVTLYRNDDTDAFTELTVADTFASWNTEADGTGNSYYADDAISLREDITLYAQWDKAVLGDYEYELRPGYYLYGWFDSPEIGVDGNPVGMRYLPETEITKDIALYGIWKETDTTTLYYGDVNRDGIVDFLDLSTLNRYRLDKDAPDYDMEEYLLRADADRDRDADMEDIEILNDLRLNKISQTDLAAAYTGTTVVAPAKVKFAYGEPLDTSGLGLTITFNGNASYTITDNLKVSGYDPEQVGTQTLTVTFYQFAATYSVTVEEKPDETISVTINNVGSATSGAAINAPSGGWTTGSNTFTVTCESACVVAVSNDGGKTYTRLTATATEMDNTYSFTVENMTENTILAVTLVGDANGDGIINSADITRFRAAYADKITLDALQRIAVDVNGNGEVNSADITKLRAAYAGKTVISW